MEYLEQAKNFLKKTGTTLEIVEATEQKVPLWAKTKDGDIKCGINYTCTLKNKNATYTFDFWNSIKKREIIEAIRGIKKSSYDQDSKHFKAVDMLEKEGIAWQQLRKSEEAIAEIKKHEPNEYDVLACISPLYEDNFEDFCAGYGYETDSIVALKTFEACKEQDWNLRKLFDRAELEQLSEIQ